MGSLIADGDGIVLNGIYILAILAGAGTVIGVLFRLLISSKDRELEAEKEHMKQELAEKEKDRIELESLKKSYQEIAAEALRSARETTNFYREKEGKPPMIPLAPVISESHSPSTAKQREIAAVATMRAEMAAIKLVTGQEPREEPPHATEEAGVPTGKVETATIVGEVSMIRQEKPKE